MRFYYNDEINVCAEEPWVIDYLIENGFCEDEAEVLDGLHTRRSFGGWFDCEVSPAIEKLFSEK